MKFFFSIRSGHTAFWRAWAAAVGSPDRAEEARPRSGPPSRPAATQEPERKAVRKPAARVSLAVSPSQTAGMTTKPGSASKARNLSGGVIGPLPRRSFAPRPAGPERAQPRVLPQEQPPLRLGRHRPQGEVQAFRLRGPGGIRVRGRDRRA